MATTKEQRPAREARTRALAAREQPVREAEAAAAAVAAAERALRGYDDVARSRAAADLPRLRLVAAEARAAVMEADAAATASERLWREEALRHHRPRIAAAERRLIAALERVRDTELADVIDVISAARADGVQASSLPLGDLTVGVLFGRRGAF